MNEEIITINETYETKYYGSIYEYFNYGHVKYRITQECIYAEGPENKKGRTSSYTIPLAFRVNDRILMVKEVMGFENCVNIQEITISEGIEEIGWNCFENCTKLRNVTLHKGLKKIDIQAFAGCIRLKEITIPDGIQTLTTSLFEDCKNLNTVILPNSIRKVYRMAFKGCTSLRKISFNEPLLLLGDNAFTDCHNLTEINIPHIDKIEGNPFRNCDMLQIINGQITIVNRLVIHQNTLIAALDTSRELTIPYGVTAIGECAFLSNKCTEVVTCPSTLKQIKRKAFWKSNLQRIHFTGTLEGIEPYAFDWSQLTEITLPDGLTTIEEGTFESCKNLESVTFSSSIKWIDKYAFLNCESIKSIKLPDSVEQIRESVFKNCFSLSKVKLGKGMTHIGDFCFQNCTSLSHINLSALVEIGFGVFFRTPLEDKYSKNDFRMYRSENCVPYDIYMGTPVDVRFNAYGPGQLLFENCQTILSACGNNPRIKTIYEAAFLNCINLHTANFPSVEIVKEDAFRGCTSLTKVVLSDHLKEIGPRAFAGCSSLSRSSITIPEGAKVDPTAFEGCKD